MGQHISIFKVETKRMFNFKNSNVPHVTPSDIPNCLQIC